MSRRSHQFNPPVAGRPPLRPTLHPARLPALLAALCLAGVHPALAADEVSVATLQAEIARLRQALQATEQALAAKRAGQPVAPAAAGNAADVGTAAPQATAVPAEPVPEEQTLDAVVIRTRDRVEKLQDVPVSVSVVNGKELSRLNVTDITQLVQRAGNVQWNFGNQRTSSLSIRGIGKQGQTEAQDPAVGLIVDGVSYAYNALSSSFDFTDIDTLEVARGPQGTLLGKNSSIGAINITTNRPAFNPSADFKLTFGQRQTVKEEAAIGGPIIDGLLAWRGNISASKGQGDVVNAYAPDLTYTNTDRLSGRVQFLLTPNENFSARLEYDQTPNAGEYTNNRSIYTNLPGAFVNGVPVNATTLPSATVYRLSRPWFTQGSFNVSNGFLYGLPGGNQVNINAGQPLLTGSKGATAELNWNLGNGFTLTSITAYKGYHFDAINDEGTPFDVNTNSGGFLNNYRQLSQEFRLSSPLGGFVDYQAGLYALDVHNTNEYRKGFGSDAAAYFANNTQFSDLYATPSGKYLLGNALNGLTLDYNQPAGYQDIRNRSVAVFGQANWHLSAPLTLTTGLRLTQEDRQNTGYSAVTNNGNAGELNPASVNNINLGGFNSASNGSITGLTNSAAQLALADTVAAKYFGVTGYNNLSTSQLQQVADAKAIRAAQIGVLFPQTNATPFHKILPAFVISPSYKLNEDQTAYFSIQHGEKAGVAQFTNGVSNPVRPERTTAFELGLKSTLLDRSLIFDIDAYLMNVIDYQQTTQIVDQYTTVLNNNGQTSYTSATGNVPQVQSKGLEIDAKYVGIRNTTLRFAGAYTNAKYITFTNAVQPVEAANPAYAPLGVAKAAPYTDLSGHTLPGAARWTYNTGIDHHLPVTLFGGERVLHTSVNVAYSSPFNSDQSLSQFAWIGSSYITDLAVGIGNQSKDKFDVSLIVKNLFNDQTPVARTWNSYTPAAQRFVGVVFSGKL